MTQLQNTLRQLRLSGLSQTLDVRLQEAAAGRLGHALSLAFAEAGWQVRAQSRKDLPADLASHPGVMLLRCDALDVAALKAAAQGAQVVVHALNPPYDQWDRLALPLADAAIATARAASALLMLPGNVYNFGREMPPVLTTATPERGDTAKARTRIELEARIAASTGLDSLVVRAGDFFGGSDAGTWLDLAMATRLASGRLVYPGEMDAQHAWAYLPDLAQAFVRLAGQRAQIRGARRVHFAGHAVDGHAMRRALSEVVGRELKVQAFPWWLFRLAAPFKPVWREVLTMNYLWRRPHRLDDASLRELIGPVPSTPLVEALRSALEAQRLMPARTGLQTGSSASSPSSA